MTRYTAPPWHAPEDRKSRWARPWARAHASSHRSWGKSADAIDIRSPPVGSAESRSLDDETAGHLRPITAPGSCYSDRVSKRRPHPLLQPGQAYVYGPHGPVDPHDGAHCAHDAVVRLWGGSLDGGREELREV